MIEVAGLSLDPTGPDPAAPLRRGWHGGGVAVERVTVEGGAGFEYAWTGDRHYLALHDLRLADGEVMVDGLAPDRTRDLRGTFSFIPPGCGASGWSAMGPQGGAFTVLDFDPGAMCEELGDRFARLDPGPRLYFRSEALRAPVARLGRLLDEGEADPLHVASLAMLAAVELLGVEPLASSGRLGPRQLAATLDHVEAHLAGRITLDDLAGAAGLSRFHFARAFKASTGLTPYAFVLARRVERAEGLLASGTPLATVAAATGFASTTQLRRAVRDVAGRERVHGLKG